MAGMLRPFLACTEDHWVEEAGAHSSAGQHEFNLSVTDPPFEQRIECLKAGDYAPGEFGIRDENRLLFCASLGEAFQDGNCYKLIAGMLELPAIWPTIGCAHSDIL
jgi:hypothetical protein